MNLLYSCLLSEDKDDNTSGNGNDKYEIDHLALKCSK